MVLRTTGLEPLVTVQRQRTVARTWCIAPSHTGERCNLALADPLDKLLCPVRHERCRAENHGGPDGGLAAGPCPPRERQWRPGSAPCLNSVHITAIACSVLPSPISSAGRVRHVRGRGARTENAA